jgi:DNA-binding beta-propeller fold protein YncE
MDRFISWMRQVCLSMTLTILLAGLPAAAQARAFAGGDFAVAPKGLAFPDKVFGASGERSWPKLLKISISQHSGRPLTIKRISIAGANRSDFAIHQIGNCVGAPRTTGCAVTVTFTPTGLGRRTATLTVTDSAGVSAESVALSGRGIKGRIKWEPREISFGKVRPGASSQPEPVSITNPNAAPLTITKISLKSADFVASQTHTCMGPLAPHASCKFYVAASPQPTAAKSHKASIEAELDIQDAAAGNPHRVMLSARLSGPPVPPPPPPPPAGLAKAILVTNTPCNNVTSYAIAASGNIAPTFPQPLLCTPTGIAVDANNIYVSNSGDDGNPSYSVAIYPVASDGQVAPSAVISGALTGLDDPHGMALDGSGNIYVVNDGSNNGDADSVTVYPAGTNGNTAPSATISGSNTGLNLPDGIAIHGSNIYVANSGNNTVTVYPVGSPPNTAPTTTIKGFSTGLSSPSGVALDGTGNIYVANLGNDTVTVYPAGSNGNTAPSATISTIPAGIALDGGGNVYVVGNDGVFVYAAGTFTPIATISARISGLTTDLDNPVAVAVDSAGKIYVANNGSQNGNSDTVSVYAAGANSKVVPTATLTGSNTQLNGPAGIGLDSGGHIYVVDNAGNGNGGSNSVTVYPEATNGNVAPSMTISGASTGLFDPQAVALDSTGKIYVSDNSDSVIIYPAGSTGNAAPTATIFGAGTGLNSAEGVAVDSAGNIYVANNGNNTVTVYPIGSNGNAAPSATIGGASTGLDFPYGIAVNSVAGKIYVTNDGSQSGGSDSVTIYPTNSNGNATPSATISGPNTGLNFPLGVSLDGVGNIYVLNNASNSGGFSSVTVYPPASNGNATPMATIEGRFTGLVSPEGIAVDSAGNVSVVNFGTVPFSTEVGQSVTFYPAGSNSNVTPTAVINRQFALTSNGMAEPVGIALDNGANVYVTNEQGFFGSVAQPVEVYAAGSGATGETPPTGFGNGPATGVVLDTGQNVYVVGPNPSEVDIFSPFSALAFLGVLGGEATQMSQSIGVALDSNGNIYVTNAATDSLGDRVTVYPAESTGQTVPSAIIVGPNTGLAFPAGIAVDSLGNIYVANSATDAVTVYPKGSNGNMAPSATISGTNTGLNTPYGIAIDSNGLIYVANAGGYEGHNVSVTVYAAGATGNATPVTTIAGPLTQLARPKGVAVIP